MRKVPAASDIFIFVNFHQYAYLVTYRPLANEVSRKLSEYYVTYVTENTVNTRLEKISRQKTARGFKASPERARAPSFGGTEQTHSAGCDAPSENLGHHGASPMPRITLRAPTTRRSQLCGRTDRLRCISHQSFRVRGIFAASSPRLGTGCVLGPRPPRERVRVHSSAPL